jgi:hypothetical protein
MRGAGIWVVAGLLAGCGGGPTVGPKEPGSLGDEELAGWGGSRDSSPGGAADDRGQHSGAGIPLASGEQLRILVARTYYEVEETAGAKSARGADCSVYVLRATGEGLVEGRRSSGCPKEKGRGGIPARMDFERVEPPRLQHLRTVLRGARPATDKHEKGEAMLREPPPGVRYRTTLEVTTDQRTIKGRVGQPAWPPPTGETLREPLGRGPRGLSELWEAVLYPHRYRGQAL